MYEMIGREEEGGVVQVRESLPLLESKCKLTANGSSHEPLEELMSTIDILFNTILVLKQFSPMTTRFLTC